MNNLLTRKVISILGLVTGIVGAVFWFICKDSAAILSSVSLFIALYYVLAALGLVLAVTSIIYYVKCSKNTFILMEGVVGIVIDVLLILGYSAIKLFQAYSSGNWSSMLTSSYSSATQAATMLGYAALVGLGLLIYSIVVLLMCNGVIKVVLPPEMPFNPNQMNNGFNQPVNPNTFNGNQPTGTQTSQNAYNPVATSTQSGQNINAQAGTNQPADNTYNANPASNMNPGNTYNANPAPNMNQGNTYNAGNQYNATQTNPQMNQVPFGTKVKNFIATTAGKITIGVVCVCLVGGLAYYFINKNDTTTVDLFDGAKIVCTGSEGRATIRVSKSDLNYDKDNEDVYSFVSEVYYTVDYDRSTIKNGDKVTVTAHYTDSSADRYNISVKSKTKEFTVKGLVSKYANAKKVPSAVLKKAQDKIKVKVNNTYTNSSYASYTIEMGDCYFAKADNSYSRDEIACLVKINENTTYSGSKTYYIIGYCIGIDSEMDSTYASYTAIYDDSSNKISDPTVATQKLQEKYEDYKLTKFE